MRHPASINHLWYYFGSQCNRIDGKWDYWNPNSGTGTHGWHASSVPCGEFSANTWHTVIWYGTRTSSQVTYSAIQIDGTQYVSLLSSTRSVVKRRVAFISLLLADCVNG
jgi:hypothetical protein